MSDLLALAAIFAGLLALLFLAMLLHLGVRFWLLCGSFASAHKIIDTHHQVEQEKLDALARCGFKEANRRGWITRDVK